MKTQQKVGLVLSLTGFSISVNILPVLVSWYSNQMRIAPEWFATVFFLQYVAFACCSLAIGKLHKRKPLPLTAILVGALFLSAIVLFLLGQVRSFLSLIIMMMVIGGCGGVVESIGTALLANAAASGRMLYSSQFFYSLGAFIAPFLVGLLLMVKIRIPVIIIVVGSFALVVGLLVMALVLPQIKRLSVDSSIAWENRSSPMTREITENASPRRIKFVWLFITMICYVFIESSLVNWLPVFLEVVHTKSQSEASLIVSCLWVGMGISRLSYVFLRKRDTRSPLIGHTLSMLLFLVVLASGGTSISALFTMALVSLIGLGIGPIWPLLIEYCSDIYQDEHLIMYLVGGGSIGAALGPTLTSALFAMTDIAYLIQILIAFAIVLCVFMHFSCQTRK